MVKIISKLGGDFMDTLKGESDSFPMLSAKNWWAVRQKVQTSIPNAITPSFIRSLLDLKDEASARSNVVSPMRKLGLIDGEGKPTELLKLWRNDDSYAQACAEMLKNTYPDELLALVSDDPVDKQAAERWFMGKDAGKAAAGKMAALLAILKQADPTPPKAITKQQSSAKQPTATQAKSAKQKVKEDPLPSATMPYSGETSPSVHIDLQLHFSPDLTPEQISTIFESMSKYLYKAQ